MCALCCHSPVSFPFLLRPALSLPPKTTTTTTTTTAAMILEHGSIRLIHHLDNFTDFFYKADRLKLDLPPSPSRELTTSVVVNPTTKKPTANGTPTEQQQRRRQGRRQHKLSVHFDLKHNQEYELEPMLDDEQDERWYSPHDMQRFRMQAIAQRRQTDVRSLAGTTNETALLSFHQIVLGLYDELQIFNQEQLQQRKRWSISSTDSNDSSVSSSSTSSSSSSSSSSPSSEWEDVYVTWVNEHPEFIGMERYALDVALKKQEQDRRRRRRRRGYIMGGGNNSNRHDKGKRRQQQIMLMHELQHRNTTSASYFMMMESNVEYIRHSCETISLPSRQFAQRMAELRATRLIWTTE